MSKTFYIVDGLSQLHRAFHSRTPDFKSSDGEPTKATYGFMKMFLKLIREHEPDYLAVAFDPPRSTLLRTKRYPGYKATREVSEEDSTAIRTQSIRVKEILKALGVPIFEVEGFEADDVIYSLAHWARMRCIEVVVVSRDKDLEQILLDDSTVLYDPIENSVRDRDWVIENRGYKPEQVQDALAILGDVSDNIPGIKGIGPKKVVELLKAIPGGVGVIKAHPEKIPIKMKPKVLAGIDRAVEMLEITRLKLIAPISDFLEIDQITPPPLELKRAGPIFRTLGIRRWAD